MRRVPTSQVPLDDRPPWLTGCYAVAERIPAKREFPFDLPFFGPDFELKFRSPIVVIAGENGSGKSTLLESLAALCGLSPWGRGRAEQGIAGERSGAELFLVDGATVRRAIPEETPHWSVLRDVLSDPGRFWRAEGAQGP